MLKVKERGRKRERDAPRSSFETSERSTSCCMS